MKINKRKFEQALVLTKPGLASKETIEQGSSFVFTEGKIVTFNDEICIQHPIHTELEGAIKAEQLYNLIPQLKHEEIEITTNESEIVLSCGRTKATITRQEEIVLPLDSIGKISNWVELPKKFIEYAKLAIGAVGKDNSRPILTCVHIHEDGIIEGSDGLQLMRCELDQRLQTKTMLVPAKALAKVIDMHFVAISNGIGWAHFQTKEGSIVSLRVMEEKVGYPNTDELMKPDGESIELPRTFREILGRASVFAKRDHPLDEVVDIRIKDNRLKIRAESDNGSIEEEANIRYKGEGICFRITPYLLREILSYTRTCEVYKNRLKFQGEGWSFIAALFDYK